MSGPSGSRRAEARARRAASKDAPEPIDRPAPSLRSDTSARRPLLSRTTLAMFAFCVGALAMKIIGGALPPFFTSAFDLLVYAGVALTAAIAYRRFVRRALEDRRRERARREAREANR